MNAPSRVTPKPAPPVDQRDLDLILEKTGQIWQELRGRRIFITGGTGFFGCWLLESFLAANKAFDLRAQATVLTRFPEQYRQHSPHLADAVEILAGDVRDIDFPSGEFAFVIHAATASLPKEAPGGPEELRSTIVDSAERCLEFAESHGTRKFLFTSSGAVYGPQPLEITHIPENYRGRPDHDSSNAAYAEGKRAAEMLCALAAGRSGMECKIARCFSFIGPHLPLDAHSEIGNFIRDALRGGPIAIAGDGAARRSYLYAADLAIWLWTILLRAPSMRPLNVGSEEDRSVREIAEAVAAAFQPGMEITVAQKAVPGAAVERYVPSVEAARQLGLTETVALEEAIRRTVAWAQAG